MIFQYETQRIGTEDYISGSFLVSEEGMPSGNFEFSRGFAEDLFDENFKLQWAIRDNPDWGKEGAERYIIELKPQVLTVQEIEDKRQQGVKSQFSGEIVDLVYQYKDDPSSLVQALCDRMKEIDSER